MLAPNVGVKIYKNAKILQTVTKNYYVICKERTLKLVKQDLKTIKNFHKMMGVVWIYVHEIE